MQLRFRLACIFLAGLFFGTVAVPTRAQDESTPRRGRKYKAPPETSHIEVQILKGSNDKPVSNAAVIFHAVKEGKDEGNLEVKTNEEGKAIIDVIATGSEVQVQVIADGFATYSGDFQVNEPSRMIEIKMVSPRAQVSTYVDNSGKTSERPMGVQEPATPATLPGSPVRVPPPPAAKSVPVQPKPVQTNPPPDSSNPVTSSPIPTNPPPDEMQ